MTTVDPEKYQNEEEFTDINNIFLGWVINEKTFLYLISNFSEVNSRPFFALGKRTYWDKKKEEMGVPQNRPLLLAKNRTFNLYSNIKFLGTPLSAIKGIVENVNKAWVEVDRLGKTNFLESDTGSALDVSAYEKDILEQAKALPRRERKKIEKQIAMMKQNATMEFLMTTQIKLQETKREISTKKKDDVERFFVQINDRLLKLEIALESLENWQPTPIDRLIKSAEQVKDKI